MGTGEVIKVKKLKDDVEIDVVFESAGLKHLLVSLSPYAKYRPDFFRAIGKI